MEHRCASGLEGILGCGRAQRRGALVSIYVTFPATGGSKAIRDRNVLGRDTGLSNPGKGLGGDPAQLGAGCAHWFQGSGVRVGSGEQPGRRWQAPGSPIASRGGHTQLGPPWLPEARAGAQGGVPSRTPACPLPWPTLSGDSPLVGALLCGAQMPVLRGGGRGHAAWVGGAPHLKVQGDPE